MLEAVKDSSEDENDKDEKEHLKGNITEKLSMSFSNEDEKESAGVDASVEITPAKKKGVWENLKQYVSPPDDGSTFRQRLAKLGLAAALSYGWVSNMSYSVSVSLAWYIFSKRVGTHLCRDELF